MCRGERRVNNVAGGPLKHSRGKPRANIVAGTPRKHTRGESMNPAHQTNLSEPVSLGKKENSTKLTVERDHAEILIHTPREKVNKLSRATWEELQEHFSFLKNKGAEIKTLLIYSDKPDMFLAGADITEIERMTTKEQALDMVEKAQDVFQMLSELPQVSIVAIDGACLGGGLELALACNYRICSDSPSTKLGLPEVNLGVIPGSGGTQRLPRVIGLVESIKMITSGAPVDARKALKIGLVSDVIPVEYLLSTARKILKDKSYFRFKPKESTLQWFVEVSPFKKFIYHQTRKAILDKTKGFYPAPLRAVDVIERTFHGDIKAGLKIEAEAFADLAIQPTAKNLIGLFFASDELKKERGIGPMEAHDFKPLKITNLGVLGAGIMGGGIAAVASGRGIAVRMKDVAAESILHGLKTARSLFEKDYKRKKIDKSEFNKRMYRISPTLQWTGFGHIPFVIEAVVEKMEIKKSVFSELEKSLPENAIIASNTSSLSISEMAAGSKRPERIVGMHFFNPVPKMPLVEVVRAEKTSPETVAQTVAFGRQLGKTVIVVKDRPGFLVNRILMPFLNESGHLREDGYSIAQIDKAATDFGMPMGPFRLLDEVGLDTAAKVADVIATAFQHMKVLPVVREMVSKGFLGRKNNKGFYNYDGQGKSVGIRSDLQSSPKEPGPTTDKYIQDRLILPMVTEAVMALDEGVVSTVRDLDLGLIYGIGFPPFLGGLLKWVSSVGEREILDRMNHINQATKGRLIVSPSYVARVQSGQTFYR
ncbi:MAG: multifunctional fatty acid oxidation complex subunit alpha [Bacteriovoracaceae bacterium]|nr:multifunctional fatty acid oxidation complex subunit alpha [Bacteriovoracaceae bacterium]